MRAMYNAGMRLDFNLLLFVRFISPGAVLSALGKAQRRVYGKYGIRTHYDE